MRTIPDDIPEDMDPDELAGLIDSLVSQGVGHIDLRTGDDTVIRTVSSTALCENGACSVPTLGSDPYDEETDDDEL